ncbi:MAG: trimeric intracellular cation channel family protein [Acutalibacteraceae bacterium]
MQAANLFFEVTEFVGIIAFAISGAMISISRRMDIFGVIFLGLVTALGGGAIRDLFLGVIPPRNFFNFEHLLCALLTSAIVFILARIFRDFFFKNYKKINLVVNFFDAVGLASFAISGVRLTIEAGYGGHDFFVVFMGIFTAVGGGMLRDVMSKEKPMIFCKNVYATAVLIGTVLYYILSYIITFPEIAAMLITYAVIILTRLLAAKYRWDLPKIEDPTQQ